MEEAALAYAREYYKREPLLVNRRGDRTGLMHWRVQEARQNSGLTAEAFSSEPPMTKEEALRLAQEEGLSLLTSKDNATGYQCVAWQPNGTARAVSKGKLLGTFSGAPEAALAHACVLVGQALGRLDGTRARSHHRVADVRGGTRRALVLEHQPRHAAERPLARDDRLDLRDRALGYDTFPVEEEHEDVADLLRALAADVANAKYECHQCLLARALVG